MFALLRNFFEAENQSLKEWFLKGLLLGVVVGGAIGIMVFFY